MLSMAIHSKTTPFLFWKLSNTRCNTKTLVATNLQLLLISSRSRAPVAPELHSDSRTPVAPELQLRLNSFLFIQFWSAGAPELQSIQNTSHSWFCTIHHSLKLLPKLIAVEPTTQHVSSFRQQLCKARVVHLFRFQRHVALFVCTQGTVRLSKSQIINSK